MNIRKWQRISFSVQDWKEKTHLLNPMHLEVRLKFTKEYLNNYKAFWDKDFWSDENASLIQTSNMCGGKRTKIIGWRTLPNYFTQIAKFHGFRIYVSVSQAKEKIFKI